MEIKKTLTTLLATATICSCNNLPFSKKPTGYETERIVNLLESAAKKGIAKTGTDSLGSRTIKLDLNSFNDEDSTKSKNPPRLYGIFGVDEITYVDKGREGYSKQDTLITNVSYLLQGSGGISANYSLKDSKKRKYGMPDIKGNSEFIYEDSIAGRKFIIWEENVEALPSYEEAYFTLMNQVEVLIRRELYGEKEENSETEKKRKKNGRKGKNFNK